MANPHAGEVALVLDGEARVLKLTLGALAELEDRLQADSLPALVERFEAGALRGARRAGAALRGAARRRLGRGARRPRAGRDRGRPAGGGAGRGAASGPVVPAAAMNAHDRLFDWPGLMRAGMQGLA